MLILTRRVDETVVIDSHTKVTVLGVKGANVRVGIEAPLNIRVQREEVFDRINQGQAEPPTAISDASS